MFDVKISDFKIDSSFFDKPLNLARELWFGTPKWLRYLLVVTVIGGACYFLWNRVMISYDMEDLQNEVVELNKVTLSSVIYERYSYDVSNVVMTVKTIEEQIEDLYDEDEALIELLREYIKKQNPNDPALKSLDVILQRRKLQKESLDKIIDYKIDMYENIDWNKVSKNNNTLKDDDEK